MGSHLLEEQYKASQSWLASQPDMDPWDEGCRRLTTQLGGWVESLSEPICEAPVPVGSPGQGHYLPRLWQCVSYHWEQARDKAPQQSIGVTSVVQRLREGRGWQRGGKLGGDPMRDMILAVAMTLRDGRAPGVFESDYYGFARGLAARMDRRLSADPDSWWTELLDFLAGYSEPPGKLVRFHGKCALRNWLGTVLWNYLRRRRTRRARSLTDLDIDVPTESSPSADWDDLLKLFAGVVRQAFGRLSDTDRLMFSLIYVDGLKQKDVAELLGIDPGTVTRRIQKALDQVRQATEAAVTAKCDDASFRDLLDDIAENPRVFADALCDVLRRTRREGP